MIDHSQKRFLLNKIINSTEFSESKTSQKLLKYLVNSSIKGYTPKEFSIAINIFKKDDTFNPADDTIVRVHIHNLRKKLESYYLKEGHRDKIKILIPKGHYEACFVPHHYYSEQVKKIFNVTNIPWFFLLMVFAALALFFWKENNYLKASFKVIAENNPVWSELFKNDKPTLIVLGDFFFMKEYREDLDRGIRLRDVYINSSEELDLFKSEHPEYENLIPDSVNTFLHKDYAFCLQDILLLLFSQHKRAGFKLVSHLLPKDLINNNIIFLGNFKNLGILGRYFDYSKFTYQLYTEEVVNNWPDKFRLYPAQKILYRADNSDSVIVYARQGSVLESHTDYAIVAKFPGPNMNVILLFSSFYSAGIYEAVKRFTHQTYLNEFQELVVAQYQKMPPYFEVLLEATGLDRTGYQSQIKHVNKVDPKMNLLIPTPSEKSANNREF